MTLHTPPSAELTPLHHLTVTMAFYFDTTNNNKYLRMTTTNEKHALILGASGISGWALLNQVRTYPSKTSFTRISAQTNRPLSKKDALIPDDDRINLFNGVDFTKSVEEVKKLFQEKVKEIDTVTHVYFTGTSPEVT